MDGHYEYMWLIGIAIFLVVFFKVLHLILKKKTGECGEYSSISNESAIATLNSVNYSNSSDIYECGPVNYFANARHNQKDRWFQFMYRKVNGEWLAYILRMPSLNGRDPDLHITHRYNNGNTYWICYDPQPRTLEGAQSVSRAWSDRELEYIATGIPFEEQKW